MQNDDRDTKRIKLDESKLLKLGGRDAESNERMIGVATKSAP